METGENVAAGEGGPAARKRRTFVLVHGAWHGGWCWARVEPVLREAGHRVFRPTQTGLGERSHLLGSGITLDVFIDDIANLLVFEELEDVVLVGHSFGGNSISGVADRMPERLKHLVYLDSLVIDGGMSPFDTLSAAVVEGRRNAARDSSGGLSLPAPPASAFGISDHADTLWVERRLTPHPLATFESKLPLRGPVANGVPRTYVACTCPEYAPLAAVRERVKAEPGWNWREIATGHDAMVSAPRELAALLQEIAE